MEIESFLKVVSSIFGLLIGSFLNALIYRLPRGINIAIPRSSCTNCKKLIRWYENIPVISYLLLFGKCSGCKNKISIKYPLVEIFVSIGACLLAPSTFESTDILRFIFLFTVMCSFLCLFLIDIEHKILPNSINLYLAFIFLLNGIVTESWTFWLVGGLVGFGGPYIVTWVFYLLKGKVGLGGGDIKLFGVLGLFLGPVGIISNIFMSCFLGSLVGITLIVTKVIDRNYQIPFGPFILIAASAQIYFPDFYSSLLHAFGYRF